MPSVRFRRVMDTVMHTWDNSVALHLERQPLRAKLLLRLSDAFLLLEQAALVGLSALLYGAQLLLARFHQPLRTRSEPT